VTAGRPAFGDGIDAFLDKAGLFVRFPGVSRESTLTAPVAPSTVRRTPDDGVSGLALLSGPVAGLVSMSSNPLAEEYVWTLPPSRRPAQTVTAR
jgi:hypothetical protein